MSLYPFRAYTLLLHVLEVRDLFITGKNASKANPYLAVVEANVGKEKGKTNKVKYVTQASWSKTTFRFNIKIDGEKGPNLVVQVFLKQMISSQNHFMGLKVIPLSGFSATHPSFDKWYSLDRSPDFSGIEVMGEIHLQFEFVATPPKQCSSSLSITYKPKTEEEALEELKNQPWFREDFDRLKAEEFLKDSPEGTFVLRYTSKRDNYVLSYKEKKGINHSLIEKTPNGYTMGDICLPYVWDLLKQSKFLTFQDSRTNYHVFTRKQFNSPTWCHLCKKFIWGLVLQGYMCVSCGYCAHEWCYSHAPYDCPTASNEEALFVTFHYQSGTRKGSGQYAVSMSSSIPNYCSPPAPPTSLINISWEDCPKVKALYDYDGITDVELSFIAGDVLTLIDKPSTNWWWCEFQGFEGYAPPSYLQEIIDDDDK